MAPDPSANSTGLFEDSNDILALPAGQHKAEADRFAQLQAILTCMPQHAVPSDYGIGCDYCTSRAQHKHSLAGPVDLALMEALKEYPEFNEELGGLRVVHASADLVCFADHEEQRLFSAVRGTDMLTPRDLGNDALVAIGFAPLRVEHTECEYRAVRDQFPGYVSYGCGHSLGGAIMHELAYNLGNEPQYAFARVDVFNAGGSPFRRSYTPLPATEFLSHRVVGDLVSYFYEPMGRTIVYEPRAGQGAHFMGHFLPQQQRRKGLEMLAAQLLESRGPESRSFAALTTLQLGSWTTGCYFVPFLSLAFGFPMRF